MHARTHTHTHKILTFYVTGKKEQKHERKIQLGNHLKIS